MERVIAPNLPSLCQAVWLLLAACMAFTESHPPDLASLSSTEGLGSQYHGHLVLLIQSV